MVGKLLKEDHSLVRFYIPKEARWKAIALQTTNVGEYLTDAVRAIARENEKLQGVINRIDFNATPGGVRDISDDKLRILIDILGRYRLGIDDVAPDIIGMESAITLGDTMNNPKYLNSDGSLRKYNLVTANPMWNQNFSLPAK